MAVTANTIADTLLMRFELERYVSNVDRELARAWTVAWGELSTEFTYATKELLDLTLDSGGWPTRAQVLRAQRVQNALKASVETMQELFPKAERASRGQLSDILASAEHWQQVIARGQLPQGGAVSWSRADRQAIANIVERTTHRIHALTRPLTAEMERNMKAVLVRGVFVGENPQAAARQIMRRCEQAFNGGHARAANIARTELLDAHRAAARQSRLANSDVVKGWKWHATLSDRTCPSCLANHGSEHPNSEPGPHDHQQGRCTAIPLTKSWRELGFNQPEPADDFPNGKAWFDRQSRETKLRIMGPERLRRLESGELSWDELSMRVENPHWRDSYQVAPLRPLGQQAPKGPAGFDPTPFRNAQSADEIAKLLQQAMGDRGKVLGIDATSAKWELDRVRDVGETLAELFQRFPEVRADVEFAPKMSSKVLAQAVAQMTPMRSEFGQLTLKINKGKLSARSKFAEDWDHDVKSGFYNVRQVEDVNAMRWITRHEFGHILDYTQANKHGGGQFGMMQTRSIAFKEAEKRGWFGGGAEAAEWKRAQAGKYARSNDAEMLAEAFADVETYGDKARDLSKAIVEELLAKLGRSS